MGPNEFCCLRIEPSAGFDHFWKWLRVELALTLHCDFLKKLSRCGGLFPQQD